MAIYADCIPCQYGQHDEHHPVPGPVRKGVMGGWVCPCTGDCAERNPKPELPALRELTQKERDDWDEFLALLDSLPQDDEG